MKDQITGSDWRGRTAGRLVGALGVLLALGLVVGVVIPTYAQDDMPPAIPCYFAGTVSTSNGQSVPAGTVVEAFRDGVEIEEARTYVTNTSTYLTVMPGNYTDQDKIVSFTVGGVQASQTAAWKTGGAYDPFDLTIPELPDGNPFPLPCFVATAAYGTGTADEIGILREFRDVVLLASGPGAEFVSLYYDVSPPIAEVIWQHDILRTVVRMGFTDPIVAVLNWGHALWSETS
jgi:hypothetical protein